MESIGNTKNKSLSTLAEELNALGVSSSDYSLGHHRDERTCLVESNGAWLVYYAERGQLADLHTFPTFEAAKAYLICVLSEA